MKIKITNGCFMPEMNIATRLFFKINSLVGRNKWWDAFGRAGAEWVIVGMFCWYITGTVIDRQNQGGSIFWSLSFLAVSLILGWLLNNGIGYIVKEPRPHIKYREVKLLFIPLNTWKSFPSDHAMAAWLMVFMGVLFNVPGVEALFIMAIWVCWGRVYAGVHYPFDVVGGMAVAGFMTVVSYFVMVMMF